MREIIVEIDSEGRATVKTQGYQGPACVEAVKQLLVKLKAMGVEVNVDSQKLTPEYYATQTQGTKAKIPA